MNVVMRNSSGKTITAFAIAPKNAAQVITTIITRNSVCVPLIKNAVLLTATPGDLTLTAYAILKKTAAVEIPG